VICWWDWTDSRDGQQQLWEKGLYAELRDFGNTAQGTMLVAHLTAMAHRFLIHELNHTTLVVDITGIGLPSDIVPPNGESQSVPSLRFRSWHDAEQHLLGLGAGQESLNTTEDGLRKIGVAVLTIV
jgi:hypothetical protein